MLSPIFRATGSKSYWAPKAEYFTSLRVAASSAVLLLLLLLLVVVVVVVVVFCAR